MKKILSFLTKKPLALAAVALFSMSSFAQETGAPKEEGTTEATTPTQKIWAKLTDSSLLKPYLKVTLVDEEQGKIYTVGEDGFQKEAEDFVPGSDAEQNGSYLYVCEGKVARATPEDEVFSLNTKDEGKGFYIDKLGAVQQRMLDADVSWLKDVSEGIFNEADQGYFIYYDYNPENGEGEKIFKTTKSAFNPASLYFEKEVGLPVFDPEEGVQVNPGEGVSVTITNPNKNADGGEEGTLKWRFKGDEDWQDYEDAILLTERDEEITIEAKIVFDENVETKVVESTYLLTDIEAPEIEPESGEYKVENDGTAPVTITDATEGATISYYTKDADETVEEPTWSVYDDENKPDVADYASSEKQVTVTAKASKEVTFKGKKETVYSEETSETYTVVPNATPEDLFTGIKAKPESGSTVNGNDLVALWWELTDNTEFDSYSIAPNEEVASKDLLLTFDGIDEPVKAKTEINEDGKVYFKVPSDDKYLNSHFTVAVPEGFYKATSGKNEVLTPAATVEYTTGLGNEDFVIDPETTIQPTDKNTIVVQIYPRGHQDAEVDFANPVDGESNYGAKFTGAESEEVTKITKVEKIATDEEGNDLPNTFEITFENEDEEGNPGKAEFIKYYLENYDGMLDFAGYNVGFPAKTFKSGLYVNEEKLNHHVKFVESVDIKIKPFLNTICEGDEFILYTLELTGKVFDKSYNTPYDSDEESQVQLAEDVEVLIEGTNIFEEEEKIKAKVALAEEKYQELMKIKEVYRVEYDRYAELEEDPKDFGWNLRTDNGTDYDITIPAGTFKVNLSENEDFNGKVNVMAHPSWDVTARPYTYDEGKQETSTLTLDLTATLDNIIKQFERYVSVDNPEAKFLVDGVEVESWDFIEPSEPYETVFETKQFYMFNGRDGNWLNGNPVYEQKFGVVLHLATPIADVKEHTITIPSATFRANTCLNKKMEIKVQPKITYAIQEIKYIIPTSQKSVTYDIWGIFPDGSNVDAPIAYIGEEDPDAQNILNALRYNDAHYIDYDESGSGEKLTDDSPAFYPKVTKTQYNEDKKTTTFTITFTDKLVKGYYKMNFPNNTVQAEGYNDNDTRLYQPFDVVPAYVYDATSVFEDYDDPSTDPKEKEYNIGTDVEEITMYVTAFNPDGGALTGNANADVLLIKDTPVTLEGIEGVEFPETEVVYANVKDGIFTVTLPEGGLAEGRYSLTIPALSVTTKSIFELVGDHLAELTDDTKNLLFNPEDLVLYINVEDFAGPTDAIKITTKTYAFDVKVGDEKTTMTVIKDEEGNAPTVQLGGAQATLENSAKPGYVRVVLPTAEKEECKPCFDMPNDAPELVKGAIEDELEEEEEVTEPKLGYFFMHSCQEPEEEPAPYPLVIPAGSFKGQYATNYDDIKANVDVIFEFIDSGTGINDKLEDPNDLTTTFCEVLDEVYVQKEMLFTRAFRNQNMQALAVPFDIKQSEVADYFTIYRLDMVWEDSKGDFQLNYLSVGEDGIAYANKPYIIVPTAKAVAETKASERGAVSITFENKKVEYPMMSFINCATTKVHFQFFNTLFKQEFAEDMVEEYNWKTLSGDKIGNINGTVPAWRWWIAPVEKFGNYVKIALDGFVQDDADGIDFVEATEGDTQIFNVAGQKLNTAAKGKVNIINGKKVFVK